MQQIPELLFLALDHYRYPSSYDEQRSSAPLPPGIKKLLETPEHSLSDDNITATAAALAVSEDDCRAAVLRYVQLLMFASPKDQYRVLGLTRNATTQDIREHYQALKRLLETGWDAGEEDWADRHIRQVESAYTALGDESDRAIYDAKLAGGGIVIEWGKRHKQRQPAPDKAHVMGKGTAAPGSATASSSVTGAEAADASAKGKAKGKKGSQPGSATVSKYASLLPQEEQPLPPADPEPPAEATTTTADMAAPSLLLSPWLYAAVALVGLMMFGVYTFTQASRQAAPVPVPVAKVAPPEAEEVVQQDDDVVADTSLAGDPAAESPPDSLAIPESSPESVVASNLGVDDPVLAEPAVKAESASEVEPEANSQTLADTAPVAVDPALSTTPAPAIVATAAVAEASPTQAPVSGAEPITEAELGTLLQAFSDYYKAENTAAFAALFAEDAYTSRAEGRADIGNYFNGIFSNIRVLALEFRDVAWEPGSAARKGSARAVITALPAQRGVGTTAVAAVDFEVARSAAGALEITRMLF